MDPYGTPMGPYRAWGWAWLRVVGVAKTEGRGQSWWAGSRLGPAPQLSAHHHTTAPRGPAPAASADWLAAEGGAVTSGGKEAVIARRRGNGGGGGGDRDRGAGMERVVLVTGASG